MSALVTDAHWAAAADAVTGGSSQERAVVERVAQAIADAEERAYDAGCRDSLDPVAGRR
jgi:hypothetical protein